MLFKYPRLIALGALSLGLVVCSLSAAAPTPAQLIIDNRAPAPREIGYLPADGARVQLNPPSFAWLHESPASTYTIQWSRNAGFSDAETVSGLLFNAYTHSTVWEPGHYYWRYLYTTADGQKSGWSQGREIEVSADATPFPMPSRAERTERIPATHPRLFMRPEDLPRLRELAGGREQSRFARLKEQADEIIAAGPIPEPDQPGSLIDRNNAEQVARWRPNYLQAVRAGQQAELLAFVALLSEEPVYREAARTWLLHLASWDTDGNTGFRMNCEAGKGLLTSFPRAYDWAYDTLTPDERGTVRAALLRRATDAWNSGEIGQGAGHLNMPYDSHGNRVWHILGESGISFYDEIPEAATWLDYALNKFYSAYPVWSDDDGGWHEGVNYWAGYMGKVVWWLQVSKSALSIDGLKKPFFAQIIDFPLYLAPPHSPDSGFGDLSNYPVSPNWGGFVEYFIRAEAARSESAKASHWQWWAQQWNMHESSGVLGFLYRTNLAPLPEAVPPRGWPSSKIFHGVGIASLHTDLTDARNDVHLLFKSSPFGTQSHGHNAQNSFQLNAYGEALLPSCSMRDIHGSPFHNLWVHTTRAQNAVLVNGIGQTPRKESNGGATVRGRIVDSALSPDFDYICGDATEAYGDRLVHALRHILFIKPDMIVIYDELLSKEPATFQFMLHAYRGFTVDEPNQRLKIELPAAGADIRYFSATPLSFKQWDGYEPPPQGKGLFPKQWHVEAGTRLPARQADLLTVIAPHRNGAVTGEWLAERVETPTAVGLRLTRNEETTLIAFKKVDTAGMAEIDGHRFSEAFFIQ